MAADRPLAWTRHWGVPAVCDVGTFETLVDREPEHERVARGEASPHLVQVLDEALVRDRAVGRRVRIRLLGRLPGELRDAVRPLRLGTHALAPHSLDPIPDLLAPVRLRLPFLPPLASH